MVASDISEKAILKMNCAKASSSVGPRISDLDSLTEVFWSVEWLSLRSLPTYRTPVSANHLCSWGLAIGRSGEEHSWYEGSKLQMDTVSNKQRGGPQIWHSPEILEFCRSSDSVTSQEDEFKNLLTFD